MGLHSYSWSSSEAPSFETVERRCEAERKAKAGFPRKCLCGTKPSLLTCIKNDGLGENNVGRKYFTCREGGCAMLKWWDEVVMEELDEMKMEKQQMEDTLQYINTDGRGQPVDPQMIWLNVQSCQDDVHRLFAECAIAEEKHEELKFKLEELESHHLILEVERRAKAVKEMKILTAIAVSVALVAFVILLFK